MARVDWIDYRNGGPGTFDHWSPAVAIERGGPAPAPYTTLVGPMNSLTRIAPLSGHRCNGGMHDDRKRRASCKPYIELETPPVELETEEDVVEQDQFGFEPSPSQIKSKRRVTHVRVRRFPLTSHRTDLPPHSPHVLDICIGANLVSAPPLLAEP